MNADDFRPLYLRKSQAERQREEAEKAGEMEALAAGRLVKEMALKKETMEEDAR